ncbi:MAG: hypothetical protein RR370_02640 [Synergistaceae bacterium]
MTLERQLTEAIVMATTAHMSQLDKGGNPYILHPICIMNNVDSIEEKIVAVLHDILEDTSVSVFELGAVGIDKQLISSIDMLTKRKKETYFEYIDRIAQSGDVVAMNVKIEDLTHNMDTKRLKELKNTDIERLSKYARAMQIIKSARQELEYEQCKHKWSNTGYGRFINNTVQSIHMCEKCGKREYRDELF